MTLKTATAWSANPAALMNLIAYDSATTTYDSATTTYDSIVVGNQTDTEKVPEQWIEA